MGKRLYVGNLRQDVTDGNLKSMFATHGTVESARVAIDRETGNSRGFGYVEMKSEEEARAAAAALHGQDSGGQALKVRDARPRPEKGGSRRIQSENPPADRPQSIDDLTERQ
jgi:cold-inducible RNA-binding protein